MEVCPYLEETFKIIGRSWNGLIINYLSRCPENSAHFSDMKKDLKPITPRALSLKLTELMDWNLVEKNIISKAPLSIVYQLTDKGEALAKALIPMEEWAQKYVELENNQVEV
ncbi:transcriptional regulator [Staphylococcus condimenti]|uniref:Transcriptional regulator n=1 Tax=Staphylococcus condimenti TaxID=70255 RepID=A0A143PFU1_9STAP|nr:MULTISPECIES: helix-turn-helix domain-containing protein [Staphylococcus]AMY06619.1 HxlR family transcriptional regulator [Staphylococcus condimenti]APR60500.1 transcriptional regulator [Staphylococcus condimenti]MDK8645865.1 helix-turn-helix domain-containing protein [Staphylococcus condimenti]OFP03412.1 HxlR family transcriptional regulator [Staphylococcus sp. HMSC065E08]PNZ61529.1 transcriptional regulator [Staphylococcus condimenti]